MLSYFFSSFFASADGAGEAEEALELAAGAALEALPEGAALLEEDDESVVDAGAELEGAEVDGAGAAGTGVAGAEEAGGVLGAFGAGLGSSLPQAASAAAAAAAISRVLLFMGIALWLFKEELNTTP